MRYNIGQIDSFGKILWVSDRGPAGIFFSLYEHDAVSFHAEDLAKMMAELTQDVQIGRVAVQIAPLD
jgi:hypothetical protein